MAQPSPLESRHEAEGATTQPYGEKASLISQFESAAVEYGALRKTAGWMDCPHRGLLRATGSDRRTLLHRLTTQHCENLKPGDCCRTFLLNNKGRIDADLTLIEREDATWIDLDVHDTDAVAAELEKMCFGEDFQIENHSDQRHRVTVIGPDAEHIAIQLGDTAGDSTLLYREDLTGAPGWHLWVPATSMAALADRATELKSETGLRPIGWLAFNIARVEAGEPLFRIDFGPNNLPHETGPLLRRAVSFKKGCYRGQEIVARMENLGHPSKILTGFRTEGTDVPMAGVPIFGDGTSVDPVGAVTSSTFSPRRSGAGIGLAIVKWDRRQAGTRLTTAGEQGRVPIEIIDLPFSLEETVGSDTPEKTP